MTRNEQTLYRVLTSATKENYSESLNWLLYNLIGSTIPIWIGALIIFPLMKHGFAWLQYGSHGELALYSAAFLAPTLRVISRDDHNSTFVRRQPFILVGIVLLVIAIALYAFVIAVAEVQDTAVTVPTPVSIDLKFMLEVSAVLFVVSFLFSWLVRLIDYQRNPPREVVLSMQQADERRLDERFDETASSPSAGSSPASVTASGSVDTIELIEEQGNGDDDGQ
jgi:hypothetical protein